ncbi:MAG: response regulator [Oligoflexia bacterium]|nr:response regulator [Oligoflexia bacterium]
MSSEKIEHIVLIDDEPSVVFALKLLLQALGYKVQDFSNPQAAVEWFKDNIPADVCLCDLKMPGLNGLQVLDATKRLRPELPFVLMSAHATGEEIEQALSLGASGFLSKPFTPEELQQLLADLIKGP